MHSLSAGDLLHIWEWGQGRSPVAQALLMLSVAYPEMPAEQLAALPIGQRDARLLRLRSQTFGSRLEATARCPVCGEALAYGLAVEELVGDGSNACGDASRTATLSHRGEGGEGEREYEWRQGSYRVSFRLVTSADFLAIGGQSEEGARAVLLQRCLRAVWKGEAAIAPEDLPDEVVQGVGEQMAQRDPQAEIVLNLSCLNCEHQWTVLFDIVSFFWREIATAAQRLLQEVHVLASTYSWRESEILAMSPLRRQAYLNQIAGQTGRPFGEVSG